MREKMGYKFCILMISMGCYFFGSHGQEPVAMTILSINHFESETDSLFQCRLTPPDNDPDDVTVESLRTGWTRNTAEENLDPPPVVYTKSGRRYHKVNMYNYGNNSAFGVFACKATKNGKKDTIISTTRMRSDADIVPMNGLFTQTVSIGDLNVTISMNITTDEFLVDSLRWRNNTNLWGGSMPGIDPHFGVDTFTIEEPVQLYHAGIYECHKAGGRALAKHGLNLLIVRACPHMRWGPPDCEGVCYSCYNGGVCDESTGQCVCAPGFTGMNCLTACGGNRYGYNCEQQCTYNGDPKDRCGGNLFCLVHPFGCRCNTGFKGLDCNQACDENTFGASCLQVCHCVSDQCNRYTGECEGTDTRCDPGWTGEFCQEECNKGYFGSGCEQKCHCSPELCNRESGLCQTGGCLPQWIDMFPPHYCQTGLESATFTQVNPNVAVPVNCTAVQGPGGNLNGYDVVLSRSMDTVDETDITFKNTFLSETTITSHFSLKGGEKDVYLYCQLRDESDVQVAMLAVNVSFYDLPVLKNAPMNETTTHSSVTISWSAWDRDTDFGDPPIVGYIPYYRKKGNNGWIAGSDEPISDSLQFTFNVLESDIDYAFSVSTVREGEEGEGQQGPTLEVKTLCAGPLKSPQSVVANIAGEGQELVEISWKHPSDDDIRCRDGIQKFIIYYSATSFSSNDESSVEVKNSTATSWIIDGLERGEKYVFEMTLITEGGESTKSSETHHLVPVLPELSSAPNSTNRTSTTIAISWSAWNETHDGGTPPVVSYKVYYKISNESDWTIFTTHKAVIGQDDYLVNVTNLASDTEYDFSVAAVREGYGGEGQRSPALRNQRTICAAPPSLLQEVTANIAGEKQELVEISWEQPTRDDIRCSGGVLMFKIYYSSLSPTPNDEGFVEITNSSATSYTVDGLLEGEEYVFQMTLITEGGESANSSQTQHIVPELPQLSMAPRVSNFNVTTMTISWAAWNGSRDKGTPPIVSYNFYFKLSNLNDEMWNDAISYNASEELDIYYATVEDLTPDTLYDFRVTALREGYGGEGKPSPPLKNRKTLCDAPFSGPQDVLANISGKSQELVEISWKNPPIADIRCSSGVIRYNIYYASTPSNDKESLQVTNSEAISHVIDGLNVGDEYVFYMTLTTEGGESSESDKVQHLVPELPLLQRDLSSKENGCTKITITWHSWTNGTDKGTPPIVEYIPYHKPSSEDNWMRGHAVSHMGNQTTNEYTFENLIEEEMYDFAITVVREYGGEGDRKTYQEKINKCPVSAGAIVGSTMGSLLFLILVIILIILWMRSGSIGKAKDNEEEHFGVVNNAYSDDPVESATASKNLPEDDNEAVYANVERPAPILLVTLEHYIKTVALEQQFLTFKNESQFAIDVGAKEENKTKNRFRNMIAYDHSRVVLPEKEDEPHSDYYNANYIKNSKGEIGFIASQGPNKASVEDFWRMVWMKKVSNIVMLTNLVERGKDRCFHYWPNTVGETTTFGTVKVKWEGTDQYANFDTRDYRIIVEKKSHRVRNWHFKTWPDKDIPDQPSPLIEFARRVKTHQKNETSPLLVHCSAGVGRTGTFIALCSLMDVVETSEKLDVYGFVEQMRQDRINMVQTPKQYTFLHECLLEVYLTGDTAIPINKLTTFNVRSQGEKLSREFKLLAKLDKMAPNNSSNATQESTKCRFPDLTPVEKKRPYLQSLGKNSSSNYINACFVMSYRKESSFIATQSPLPSTIEDFWRLVFDWKCPLIVMLNQLDESDDTVCKYWPDAASSQYGHITVELKEEQKESRYIRRLFEVDHAHMKKPITVHHLQLNTWDENNIWDIHSFVKEVEKLQRDFRMIEPTVIHCINGVGRTGVVIAVKSEMERIESEEKVDVFTTVRQIRASNHNLVHTEEEYTLCHQLLKLSFPEATYANI